jgi:hypothetical protein
MEDGLILKEVCQIRVELRERYKRKTEIISSINSVEIGLFWKKAQKNTLIFSGFNFFYYFPLSCYSVPRVLQLFFSSCCCQFQNFKN